MAQLFQLFSFIDELIHFAGLSEWFLDQWQHGIQINHSDDNLSTYYHDETKIKQDGIRSE